MASSLRSADRAVARLEFDAPHNLQPLRPRSARDAQSPRRSSISSPTFCSSPASPADRTPHPFWGEFGEDDPDRSLDALRQAILQA